MCGRIVDYLTDKEIVELYSVVGAVRLGIEKRPNYNVRPTDPVRAVRLDADHHRELSMLRWGFVPAWSREMPKQAWINAKVETVAQANSMWRAAFQSRRCLVPVSGFYEWEKRPDGSKQPYFIHLADDAPMAFPAIWESWRPREGAPVESVATVTCAPSPEFARFHDRQAVILHRAVEQDAWLDPDTPLDDALGLLTPLPEGFLHFRPVGSVLNVMNEHGKACIAEGRTDALAKPLKIRRPLRAHDFDDGQQELL